MSSRELLDILAEYVEARAIERDRQELAPNSAPLCDLEEVAQRWDVALRAHLEQRP